MKKFIIAIVFSLLFSLTVSKAENVKVIINGRQLAFDTEPITQNDRTLVPMRAIFESFGYNVNWNEEEQSVTAIQEEASGFFSMGLKTYDVIYLKLGSNLMQIGKQQYMYMMGSNTPISNQKETIPLDCVPLLYNDRTYVPLRAIAESIGCDVEWQESENAVYITASDTTVKLNQTITQEVIL